MNVRLVDLGVVEEAGRDLLDDAVESGALLLERDRVIEVLVPQVLNGTIQRNG